MSDHSNTKIIIDHNTDRLGARPPKKPVSSFVVAVIVFIGVFLLLVDLENSHQPPAQPTKIRPTSTPLGPITCIFSISDPRIGQTIATGKNYYYPTSEITGASHEAPRPFSSYTDFVVIANASCSNGKNWLYAIILFSPESQHGWIDARYEGTYFYLDKPDSPAANSLACDINFQLENHIATRDMPNNPIVTLYAYPGSNDHETIDDSEWTYGPYRYRSLLIYSSALCNDGTEWWYVYDGYEIGWIKPNEVTIISIKKES